MIAQDHVLCVRSNRDYLKYQSKINRMKSLVRITSISLLKPRIVLQSKYDLTTFIEWRDNSNVNIIYNNLPVIQSPMRDFNRRSQRVIFVGNLSDRKKFKRFVEIANACSGQKIQFEAYGIPVWMTSSNVKCHGYVDGYEKYRNVSLLINLSSVDSFPNTIFEAIAHSVPIKSEILPILDELNFPSNTFLERGSAELIAANITDLLSNREAYDSLLISQKAATENLRFNWEEKILNC